MFRPTERRPKRFPECFFVMKYYFTYIEARNTITDAIQLNRTTGFTSQDEARLKSNPFTTLSEITLYEQKHQFSLLQAVCILRGHSILTRSDAVRSSLLGPSQRTWPKPNAKNIKSAILARKCSADELCRSLRGKQPLERKGTAKDKRELQSREKNQTKRKEDNRNARRCFTPG